MSLLGALALLASACGGDDAASDAAGAATEAAGGAASTAESAAEEATSEATGGGSESESAAAGGGEVSGTVEVDGSSTVGPLTQAVSEVYREEAPGVTVNVGISGTGGGFERFCADETDINDASRPIAEDEVQACEEAGIEYTEVRVGTDALAIVGNAGGPVAEQVTCLTFDQLAQIWAQETAASNWSELDPSFPDAPITVYAPDTDSGTYDFFTEEIIGEESQPIQDYTASADDNVLAQGIIGTEGSFGYFGFAYFTNNQDQLNAFEVDSGDSGCVAPSLETAEAGEYPLSRPLFIYVKNSALQEKQQVEDFVRFYLNNVNSVIEQVGYVPVADSVLQEEISEVESVMGG